jgi:uncharacterized protein YdeI (YjbR/CyaY-like superfamily)
VDAVFFDSPSKLRAWFEENHDRCAELFVGFYKKSSGRPSITWAEAVDQALCFGWIDGVRQGIDETSYRLRFTPRKKRSTWSAVNIDRVAELTRLGLMQPAGLEAFERRDPDRSRIYSYEQRSGDLGSEYESRFRANPKAWRFFEAQPPSYRRTVAWWVMSAKREETRFKRLTALIEDSENGRRVGASVSPGGEKSAR